MTPEQIRAHLDTIVDPCSVVAGAPAGLAEMGLVREVSVSQGPGGAAVRVRVGLTEPGCMMGATFVIRAREILDALPGVAHVDVELEHDCDWTPADLDSRYALRLEAVRDERRQAMAERRVSGQQGIAG
ncbi:metal-sulfur cluster assembly factor [Amycolatopsis jejuensis]|uniref:metal-sulfur cluster assembly factor n=1 Tax=Amycolatopsis jejuensis TaxID=330084 RepID=UPI000B16795F|nr:iron-sulfur cluster assembly protein [Amycolatopsis jejuensis]